MTRIRQLQNSGALVSHVDHRGWHLFAEDEVEALRRERAIAPSRRRNDDEPIAATRGACADCGATMDWLVDATTGKLGHTGICFDCRARKLREERGRRLRARHLGEG